MGVSREQIIKITIQCVSWYGLEGARLPVIAKRAQIPETLLYDYFGSRDELLRTCFERIERQSSAHFADPKPTPEQIRQEPERTVFLLWSRYFRWLITHRDETRFYFAYRGAAFFPVYERTRTVPWFRDIVSIFDAFDQEYHLYDRIPLTALWMQILTVTQLYAKLVLEGELPSDEETVRSIFHIQMRGLLDLLKTGGGPPP